MDIREIRVARPPVDTVKPAVVPPRDIPVRRRGTIPNQATEQVTERRRMEESVFKRLVEGDEPTWRGWINGLMPQLRRVARGRVRNPSDIEDVIQEMWAEVYRDMVEGKVKNDDLDKFVRRSLINTIFDDARKALRRPSRSSTPIEDMLDDFPSPRDDAVELALQSDANRRMRDVVAKLSPIDRDQIVYLSQDVPPEIIASELGVSNGVVRTRRLRARQRLKELLDSQE